MILATIRDYVDPTALWKILAAALFASVVVPVAFASAIAGQGRRERALATGDSGALGTAMVLVGVAVCVGAIALGVWAMLQK